MTFLTASLPTNANPNIHSSYTMFYRVGANRGQLIHVYLTWEGGREGGRGGIACPCYYRVVNSVICATKRSDCFATTGEKLFCGEMVDGVEDQDTSSRIIKSLLLCFAVESSRRKGGCSGSCRAPSTRRAQHLTRIEACLSCKALLYRARNSVYQNLCATSSATHWGNHHIRAILR